MPPVMIPELIRLPVPSNRVPVPPAPPLPPVLAAELEATRPAGAAADEAGIR